MASQAYKAIYFALILRLVRFVYCLGCKTRLPTHGCQSNPSSRLVRSWMSVNYEFLPGPVVDVSRIRVPAWLRRSACSGPTAARTPVQPSSRQRPGRQKP